MLPLVLHVRCQSSWPPLPTSTNRVYASPKGKAAVQSARDASIPTKTKEQTEWAVKVWKEWALAKNTRLLSHEEPFSTTFCELTVSEMDSWLSRFILEVRKKNGDPYPPIRFTSSFVVCSVSYVSMDVQISSCLTTPPSMVFTPHLMVR